MLRRENASTEDVIAEREERMERMKKEEEKRDARPGEASDKKKILQKKKIRGWQNISPPAIDG
jgi:hypothetical protein